MKYNAQFLKTHIQSLLDFYYPRVIDHEEGGYFGGLLDDGTIYDATTRHLVDTCRHIYNFSVGYRLTGRDDYAQATKHGLDFLESAHKMEEGGYAWVLHNRQIEDPTRHCYGHAFVLLAYSAAAKSGNPHALEKISTIWDLLEQHFYDPKSGRYVDVIDGHDWNKIDPYRGQNANMHMCEAMLAAFDATSEARYFERATHLAQAICLDLTQESGGYIWEHFDENWTPLWDYNKDDPQNLFRPYGYLPGHFVEWTKLLLLIHQTAPNPWLLERANLLFDAAIERGFDFERNTFNYAFAPDGTCIDDDRYYWVTAEAIGAAALLGKVAKRDDAWAWYDRFWDYAETHFIDHKNGGWYRVLNADGKKLSNEKSPPAKTDYHPLSAAFTALTVMDE